MCVCVRGSRPTRTHSSQSGCYERELSTAGSLSKIPALTLVDLGGRVYLVGLEHVCRLSVWKQTHSGVPKRDEKRRVAHRERRRSGGGERDTTGALLSLID